MCEDFWRCFHCDEVFTKREDAAAHFGPADILAKPACQINAAEFRKLEAALARYREEDSDIERRCRELESRLSTATRKAEEDGYNKGVRDARRLAAT